MAELTPEQRAEVDSLKAALEAEFRDDEKSKDKEAHAQSARTDLSDLKPDMLAAMKHTLNHGTNEGLKIKLAMWGYDKLLDEGKAELDPIRRLLEGMPAPAPSKEEIES